MDVEVEQQSLAESTKITGNQPLLLRGGGVKKDDSPKKKRKKGGQEEKVLYLPHPDNKIKPFQFSLLMSQILESKLFVI